MLNLTMNNQEIRPNVDPDTGIAYGCIIGHSVNSDMLNDIFYHVENTNPDCDPDCDPEEISGLFDMPLNSRLDGADGALKGLLFWLGGAPHLLIDESPWTRVVSPCSPCVPNAGDLNSGDVAPSDGVECYALPPSWVNVE